ncbi:hypothetical protein [Ensifer sp. ENS12]|uniref:hypothetical protein n=1 Tax=Ensifer sp. ENS12 TaxID=2854774 RepID=UPI000DD71963|nr:hypothetical protein [Ensifer sp. ENS12]MBV7517373.1 hypothetical protein [Ensifer sp. ENS12]
MWKAFAVLYVLGLVFCLVIAANLLLSSWGQMSLAIVILGGVSTAIATLAAIGLVAYAFNLQLPPFGLWRPYSWLLGILLGGLSLISVVQFVARFERSDDLTSLLWLSLSLLVNYFSWLGVWRYGRRMKAVAG